MQDLAGEAGAFRGFLVLKRASELGVSAVELVMALVHSTGCTEDQEKEQMMLMCLELWPRELGVGETVADLPVYCTAEYGHVDRLISMRTQACDGTGGWDHAVCFWEMLRPELGMLAVDRELETPAAFALV